MTRRLIKPNLSEIKKFPPKKENMGGGGGAAGGGAARKKVPPPYKTHAENYYYTKQMNHRTPMVIELVGGEVMKGRIDWYDEACLKIKRDDGTNYLLFKHVIKYLYKDPEFAQDEEGDE